MFRHRQNYYQIYRVDHRRNLEQMVDEIEGLHAAEDLVEDYLRRMTAAEIDAEISYYRSPVSSHTPKILSHKGRAAAGD
jgi:hypothetical protein